MMVRRNLILLFVALFVTGISTQASGADFGTAFTYQGRLIDVNDAVDGLYDFEFGLYSDPNLSGSQVGDTVDINDMAVYDGYFTVLLDFGSSVFNGDARWLEIAVRPGELDDPNLYTTLSPRQEMTPTPYALQTRGILVDDALNVGIGAIDPSWRLTISEGGLNVFAGSSGETVGFSTSRFYVANNNEDSLMDIRESPSDFIRFSNNGGDVMTIINEKVGIGTQEPVGKLHVDGGKAMDGTWGADIVIKAQDGGDGWAMQNNGEAGGDIILLPGEGGEESGAGLPGSDGNVGIGTTSPEAKLGIASPSSGAALGVGRASAQPSIIASSDADGGWLIMDSTGSGKTGLNHYDDGDVILVNGGGDVGIGTTSPGTKLHIAGGSDASLSGNGYLMTGSVTSKNIVIDDNEIIARDNGSAARLYLNLGSGNVVVEVLEITGGSDLAEPFEVADADSVEAGMVLAIDPENPGQLRIANKPYDRTVAGIVSGANGINPGMTMTQRGTVTEGSLLVALTGRVYVLADASNESIEPGALLTTSQTPGHAMKVTDYSRAQGAILGKAMSSLYQGQGLVLVLVALQ